MKKLFVIVVLALGLAASANAQSKAIGIRGGLGGELSYEHYMGGSNFLEADLGLWNHCIHAVGIYNFSLLEDGGFGIYAGPGVSVGMWNGTEEYSGLALGVVGQLGFEYNFNIPLNISLDWRPAFNFGDAGFYGRGIALGIRYKF